MPCKINITPNRKLAQLVLQLTHLKNSLAHQTIQGLIIVLQHVQSNQVFVLPDCLTGKVVSEQLFVQHYVQMQETRGEVHRLLH